MLVASSFLQDSTPKYQVELCVPTADVIGRCAVRTRGVEVTELSGPRLEGGP
jgi:hypothetical protein